MGLSRSDFTHGTTCSYKTWRSLKKTLKDNVQKVAVMGGQCCKARVLRSPLEILWKAIHSCVVVFGGMLPCVTGHKQGRRYEQGKREGKAICCCDRASWAKREERIPTRCNNMDDLLSIQMLIIDYSLDMFRASLCPSSGEKTTCCGTVVLRCRVWAL